MHFSLLLKSIILYIFFAFFSCSRSILRESIDMNCILSNSIVDNNIILLKFYYSISKDVQLKRFNEIKNSPLKKWKYTAVDSNAQELWDKYSIYKDIMFKKTNTSFAKWEIIKADKKIYARIKTLELILKNIPYDKKTEIHAKEINF